MQYPRADEYLHSHHLTNSQFTYIGRGSSLFDIKPDLDFIFFSEYYVKVTEIFSGHKVKTKRTPATDGERHPIFRSSFSFQVPVQRLSHTSLVLTLVGCGKMRSSKTVGRAILGPGIFESDSERSHWGRMIKSPLMKVEQWHALYL